MLVIFIREIISYTSVTKPLSIWGWIFHCLKVLAHIELHFNYFHKVSFSSVQFSRSVLSDSLRPHESQHARTSCPSQSPGVYSNSCPSSRWCHPAISSSVIPFSSCPQSLPASGPFPMSQLFTWGGQSIGVSAFSNLFIHEDFDLHGEEATGKVVALPLVFQMLWNDLQYSRLTKAQKPSVLKCESFNWQNQILGQR